MIQEKQAFLRNQIIERGYDEQAFFQHMAARKKEWENLDNWTFDQLKQLVADFVQACDPAVEQPPSDQPAAPSPAPAAVPATPILPKQSKQLAVEKKVAFQSYRMVQDPMDKRLPVQLIKKRIKLSTGYPTVQVKRAQIQSYGGTFFGMLQTSEYFYTIRIADLGFQVIRKHSELLWLRQKLCLLYPYENIPLLKKYKKLKNDDRERAKRARTVAAFVEDLMCLPLVLNSKLFDGFFRHAEEGKFQNFKRGVQATNFVKSISKIESQAGTQRFRITNGSVLFNDEIIKTFTKQAAVFRQLQKSLVELRQDMTRVAKNVFNVSTMMSSLAGSFATFNASVPAEQRCQQVCEVLSTINMSLVEWAKEMESFAEGFPVMLQGLVKDCKHMERGYEQFNRRVATAKDEYLRFKAQLTAKKERLFQSRDLKSWQIPESVLNEIEKNGGLTKMLGDKSLAMRYMCVKDSKAQEQLREWFGLMNEKGVQCGRTTMQRIGRRLRKELIQVADLSRHNLQNQLQALGGLKALGLEP